MKICILSMQMVNNYGSLLQSYGLKKIVEKLGGEVEFINIKRIDEDYILRNNEFVKFSDENDSKDVYKRQVLYIGRILLKKWLSKHRGPASGKRAILLIGGKKNYREIVEAFTGNPYSCLWYTARCG